MRASTKSDNAIEMINNSPVLRLRNRLLPLVSLETLLELKSEEPPAAAEPAPAIAAPEQAAEGDEAEPVAETAAT